MSCPSCTSFTTCAQITQEVLNHLIDSGRYVLHLQGFNERRTKMVIMKMKDGSLEMLDIDIKDIGPDMVANVHEVYQIAKVFEPVITVKLRPKDAPDPLKPKEFTPQGTASSGAAAAGLVGSTSKPKTRTKAS